MHTNARTLEDGAVVEGDLCIIGAGPAGISMALEWAGTDRRVLLLEGGGFELSPERQKLYQSQNTGRTYYPLQSARLHYFGGATNHWGGHCAPLDPIDFEPRDWVPRSGWPIDHDDLVPYYRRAASVAELPSERWNPEYWAEQLGQPLLPTDAQKVQTKVWQRSGGRGKPLRFGPAYRDEIEQAGNVHLFTHANVCTLSANDGATEVEEAVIRHFDGKEQSVRAPQFVLACGGVQNARLLLASNDQAPRGLGNEEGQVGRYFMEHLEVDSAKLVLPEPRPLKLYRFHPSPSPEDGRSRGYGRLRLSPSLQRQHRTLNGVVRFRLRRTGETSPYTFEYFPSDARKVLAAWEKRFESPPEDGAALAYTTPTSLQLNTRLEQPPNPDSRVTLSEETDALGMPRAELHWSLSETDKRSIRVLNEEIAKEAGRMGLGRVRLMDWLTGDDERWPDFLTGGWHHMGTTRMAKSPNEGVVDSNCKVHGVSNLHVAGASVFSTGGAVNPTLSLIALALRLSDHLKTKVG